MLIILTYQYKSVLYLYILTSRAIVADVGNASVQISGFKDYSFIKFLSFIFWVAFVVFTQTANPIPLNFRLFYFPFRL